LTACHKIFVQMQVLNFFLLTKPKKINLQKIVAILRNNLALLLTVLLLLLLLLLLPLLVWISLLLMLLSKQKYCIYKIIVVALKTTSSEVSRWEFLGLCCFVRTNYTEICWLFSRLILTKLLSYSRLTSIMKKVNKMQGITPDSVVSVPVLVVADDVFKI